MIIDIVSFIVERGAQIVEFVNAVLDAVIAIAGRRHRRRPRPDRERPRR